MRPATACHTCRLGKRKCRPSRNIETEACSRCERMQLLCSFVAPSQSSSSTIGKDARAKPDQRILDADDRRTDDFGCDLPAPDLAWQQEMVSNYFSVVHDKHHSIFHKPLFERDLCSGLVHPCILYAVVSLGSRFSTLSSRIVPSSAEQKALGDLFAERAHRMIDMRDILDNSPGLRSSGHPLLCGWQE